MERNGKTISSRGECTKLRSLALSPHLAAALAHRMRFDCRIFASAMGASLSILIQGEPIPDLGSPLCVPASASYRENLSLTALQLLTVLQPPDSFGHTRCGHFCKEIMVNRE